MQQTEVIIVGRGIAGLVLSARLKEKGINNVVLHRQGRDTEPALAETLPPSALPLLHKLGLLPLFERTALQRTYGYHSVWGRSTVTDNNFFTHRPYQYGLKINKQALLGELATQLQDHLVAYEKELHIHDHAYGVTVQTDDNSSSINGKLIIDATGRKRAVLSRLGIPATDHDSIIAFTTHVPYIKHPRLVHNVFIETFSQGWGIVSKLNDEQNVMTLFTHTSNPIQLQLKQYAQWKTVLQDTLLLKDFLTAGADRKVKGARANSSKALLLAGRNWLVIGDAAISFDPLSSHGITNAIFTAHRAEQAIDDYLRQGKSNALKTYDNDLSAIFQQYLTSRSHLYLGERRWPESAFWQQSQSQSFSSKVL